MGLFTLLITVDATTGVDDKYTEFLTHDYGEDITWKIYYDDIQMHQESTAHKVPCSNESPLSVSLFTSTPYMLKRHQFTVRMHARIDSSRALVVRM